MSKSFYKFLKVFPQSPLVGVNFLDENDIVMHKDPMNWCRKQFFESGGTLSDRCPQSFRSKLEKFVNVNIFFRKHTFLEKFCCSSRMHFWQLLWSFCANVVDFSAHSRKTVTKLKKFIEKTVLYKFKKKKIIFNKIIFAKNPKCFPQSLKTTEKFEDFEKKKIICAQMSPGHKKKTVLTTMSKKIYRTSNNFLQSSLVSLNFLEENYKVMQEDRLNQCRKQFFKSGRILSGRSLRSFPSNSKKL